MNQNPESCRGLASETRAMATWQEVQSVRSWSHWNLSSGKCISRRDRWTWVLELIYLMVTPVWINAPWLLQTTGWSCPDSHLFLCIVVHLFCGFSELLCILPINDFYGCWLEYSLTLQSKNSNRDTDGRCSPGLCSAPRRMREKISLLFQ